MPTTATSPPRSCATASWWPPSRKSASRRIKHVAGFPAQAIARGLAMAGARADEVDVWAIARGRRVHLLQKARFALTHRPGAALRRASIATRGSKFAGIADVIARTFDLSPAAVEARAQYVEHHPAHLASAFHTSGLAEAACCAIDGFGDFVSVSIGHGRGGRIDVLDRVYFPHSLGLLYLAITQYLGFKKFGDEFKVMGLAPYGKPTRAEAMRQLLHLDRGGPLSPGPGVLPPLDRRGHDELGVGRAVSARRLHRAADRPARTGATAGRAGHQRARGPRGVPAAGLRRVGVSRAARRARPRPGSTRCAWPAAAR